MVKILTIEGKNIRTLDKNKFISESDLQDYLEKYPSIIPIEEVYENASQLTCIGREVPVASGAMDLLYIDQEGVLTIVETKLAKNPEIRRTVIGQLIEYASFVSQWKTEYIYEMVTNRLKQPLDTSDFGYHIFKKTEDDFKHNIEENLKNGKIHLIIAVDELNESLRSTITFLNTNSNFDIFLLQISSYEESKDKKVLIPSIFGYAQKTSRVKPPRWEVETFFKNAKEKCEQKIVDAITKLYEFTKSNAYDISWGTGSSFGSFSFRKIIVGTPSSIFVVQSDGRMYFGFGTMKNKGINEEILQSFRTKLNEIQGINISKEAASSTKYPYIKIELLTTPNSFEIFQQAVLDLSQQLDSKGVTS
jgi:hypothetical protein